jgi:hypothetical protein
MHDRYSWSPFVFVSLVGTLTEESGAATRSTTPLTSGSGKAYVCASDGTITNVQDITLSGSSLTVHCPKASGSSKIYFLLGTAPAATVGSNISAVTTTGVSTNWNYLYASADVPTSSDAIGTLTFHHIFTQAQVTTMLTTPLRLPTLLELTAPCIHARIVLPVKSFTPTCWQVLTLMTALPF